MLGPFFIIIINATQQPASESVLMEVFGEYLNDGTANMARI